MTENQNAPAARDAVIARLELRALFGNLELDLRNAHFGADVTEISVSAIFGNIEIRLPSSVTVENRGEGVLANFTCRPASLAGTSPSDGPRVRIVGRAILANVEVY